MHLMDAGERRAGDNGIGGKTAVRLDRCRVVAASKAAIQTRHSPRRDSARPSEETMRHAIQHRRADDVEAHSFSRMTMSSSAWLPTMK